MSKYLYLKAHGSLYYVGLSQIMIVEVGKKRGGGGGDPSELLLSENELKDH